MDQANPPPRRFATTRWSLVAKASGDAPDATAQRDALAGFCSAYWFPLYAFIRWQGPIPTDAEDLIQGFFARLIEKNDLADADPARGRFRTFLLASLRHFMANERDRREALKRGGGLLIVSIDVAAAEARLERALSHGATPEREFDRQWALSVLEQALCDLRGEYAARGKDDLFEVLSPLLTGSADDESSHAIAAERASRVGCLPCRMDLRVRPGGYWTDSEVHPTEMRNCVLDGPERPIVPVPREKEIIRGWSLT